MGTENHNYNTPAKGTSDWHLPVNENSERLDTDVEIRDTDANKSNYTPKNGAKFVGIDTGRVYLGDGQNWTKFGNYKTQTIFAASYPGDDLSTKVQNALADLSNGQGRIRITPNPDSDSWTWQNDLDIHLNDFEGVSIDIGNNVLINYPGTGVPLTVHGYPNRSVYQKTLTLTGGIWNASGNPTGWLRLQDVGFSYIHPNYVEFRNDTEDAFGISLENHERFTEETEIRGHYETDIGIDTVPPSITGGNGTDSFHGLAIEATEIRATTIGVRLRGCPNYTTIHNTTFQCFGDETDLLVIDGSPMNGCHFSGLKFENVEGATSPTGIVVGPDYDGYNAPYMAGLSFGGGLNSSEHYRDDGAGNPWLPYMKIEGGGFQIQELSNGKDMVFTPANSAAHFKENAATWIDDSDEGMKIDGDGYSSYIYPVGNGTITFRTNNGTDAFRLWDDGRGVEFLLKTNHTPLASPPSNPRPGDTAVADGTNWDPDGDGNAEKVMYNGVEWVEDTDLRRSL